MWRNFYVRSGFHGGSARQADVFNTNDIFQNSHWCIVFHRTLHPPHTNFLKVTKIYFAFSFPFFWQYYSSYHFRIMSFIINCFFPLFFPFPPFLPFSSFPSLFLLFFPFPPFLPFFLLSFPFNLFSFDLSFQ